MKIQDTLTESEQTFYFNWFIARNDRLHIKSNVVNPQNDKHLSRWLIHPINSVYETSKTDIDAVLAKLDNDSKGNVPVEIVVNVNGNVEFVDTVRGPIEARATVFIYGVLQGFDGLTIDKVKISSIDKTSGKDIVKLFNHVKAFAAKEGGIEELTKLVKGGGSAHLGHAILAITELQKLNNAKESPFNSAMVMEVDGLTNGLSFKMMQMPLDANNNMKESYWDVASVTGIRRHKDDFKGMIDIRASGKETDNYTAVAEVGEKANSYLLDENNISFDGNKGLKNAKAIVKDLSEKNKQTLRGTLGIFSSITRNDVKPSVLEFIYGSMVKNIARAYSERKAISVMDKILKLKHQANGVLDQNAIDALSSLIYSAIKSSGVKNEGALWGSLLKRSSDKSKTEENVKKVLTQFFTTDAVADNRSSFSINSPVGLALVYAIDATEGKAVRLGLQERLGKWEEANAVINSAANMVDFLFVLIRDQVVASRNGVGSLKALSDKEFKEVVNLIREFMPMLKGLDDNLLTALVTHKMTGTPKTDANDKNIDYSTKIQLKKGPMVYFNPIFRDSVGPGAGTGAVGTHSLDSRAIATVLNNLHKRNGYNPLDVFDASVLGGNDYLFIPMYNQTFSDINNSYSMIEDLANNLQHVVSSIDKWNTFFNDSANEKSLLPDINLSYTQVKSIVKAVSEKMMKIGDEEKNELKYNIEQLNKMYDVVHKGREVLAKEDKDIAQMVGPNGTSIVSKGKDVYSKKPTKDYVKIPAFLGGVSSDLQTEGTTGKETVLSPEAKKFIESYEFGDYLLSLADATEDHYQDLLDFYKPIIAGIIDKGQIPEEAYDTLVEDYKEISGENSDSKAKNFKDLMEHLGLDEKGKKITITKNKKEETTSGNANTDQNNQLSAQELKGMTTSDMLKCIN